MSFGVRQAYANSPNALAAESHEKVVVGGQPDVDAVGGDEVSVAVDEARDQPKLLDEARRAVADCEHRDVLVRECNNASDGNGRVGIEALLAVVVDELFCLGVAIFDAPQLRKSLNTNGFTLVDEVRGVLGVDLILGHQLAC